ncbi:DNA polymerase V subunit UmuC [Citrobacter amalonaticus]|uniref:Protein UmuC n=1 Tax=Citrobacter amalonaticus TaxID=35703 RepID=A0A2S4RYN1_CITAM|nr:Y-family DNA polymerase [Citrobacter amalonaticus]POT57663.1 DNA polymerase V subunit UmuC [Citrobacter amalonaticus]POT76810.1 DNA polymerase V subunit UmuC [Citrobacter amalonaticus]POU65889.1 DNA polymerase V subunit UmuC [Citrobacter amalonaticus]POV06046.1 DNA polymerase V subunit UmuC [Citrobacter amalonaticus]
MFALVDVNSFYASCETAFRPDLKDRPVVVLSNNDGCVIARSEEAKKIGVVMGAPYFKQKDLFRHFGVICFSSNYELYADMSNRVMTTLEEMTPRVEIYSIDEAFCDLTGVRNCRDLTDFGKEIRNTILQRMHLTVGVGIAPTRTLAKLANHAAKQWRQTGGIVDLSNIERQRKLMARMPVSEVWGVGRRLSKRLEAMGIENVLQLADADIRFIRKNFSVVLERTVRELRGESCLAQDEFAAAKQEIICSRSFGDRVTEYESMRQAICSYASRAAEKLRAEHQYCRHISAFVKTSPFAPNETYYGNTASVKLLTPTQDSRDIINAAVRCLDALWCDGHRYQKAGVMLGDFFSQGIAQLNLFDDNAPRPGSEKLMAVLDLLNTKRGKGTLWFAGQGAQQQWQMKREMLSPRYTTRISDVLVAVVR